MSEKVLIVGHKNPDNDSISSAVGYAYLRNCLEAKKTPEGEEPEFVYEPVRLGPLPPESEWILTENGIELPKVISHVYSRVSDAMYTDLCTVGPDATVLEAGRVMRQNHLRELVIEDDDHTYHGLLTMRMLAERYIEATDAMGDDITSQLAVAGNLITSLTQKVSTIMEEDVILLHPDNLLKDAKPNILQSDLREGVVLDDEGRCVGIVNRSDIASASKRKVILVDHNECRQAANGIEEAEVVSIVDHHRIGDVTTSNPIQFVNMPVGSTATIVTVEFRRHGIEIPPHIAKVLLSAIMTDTIILKSPTVTWDDREQVEYLANIAGVDPVEFGIRVFKCRGGEDDIPVEEFVCADSKEFQIGDSTVLIAQHETVDLEEALSKEDEVRAYMDGLIEERGYEFVLLMVTDIIAEGSQFICQGNRRVVNRVFGIECQGKGGTWMPGILSRKKQVAARLLNA